MTIKEIKEYGENLVSKYRKEREEYDKHQANKTSVQQDSRADNYEGEIEIY